MLARIAGARLDLFNAMPMAVSVGSARAPAEHFSRLEAERNKRYLERVANRLRREEIIVETTVLTGYPVHEAIFRQIRLTSPDLVVIEAHKHTVLARLLLTQTDFELIRHCPVPLLIVKGKAAWRSPRILAALDPFHENDKPGTLDGEIIDVAGSIAGNVGGTVHVTHVYQPLARYSMGIGRAPATPRDLVAQEKAYERSVRTGIFDLMRGLAIPKRQVHLVCGDPGREIPAVARVLRAGLVVMGAVSRSGLKRMFVGNTAERVLDAVRCDVLVVRSGTK